MVSGGPSGGDVCGFKGDGDVSFVKVGVKVGLAGFGTAECETTGTGGGAWCLWGLMGTVVTVWVVV